MLANCWTKVLPDLHGDFILCNLKSDIAIWYILEYTRAHNVNTFAQLELKSYQKHIVVHKFNPPYKD
jgi:hypothetical protein